MSFNQEIRIGKLTVIPYSAGDCIGSVNWVIKYDRVKVVGLGIE